MDVSNQDEAERCRDLAQGLLSRGEYDRAARLLRKSLQLHPLPGTDVIFAGSVFTATGVAEALEEALRHLPREGTSEQ